MPVPIVLQLAGHATNRHLHVSLCKQEVAMHKTARLAAAKMASVWHNLMPPVASMALPARTVRAMATLVMP
jgi:hypothetical protein